VSWVLHYFRDIDADLRRFYGTTWHRLECEVSGPHFFALIHRLLFYGGAVTAAARMLADSDSTTGIDLLDPSLSDLIEISRV